MSKHTPGPWEVATRQRSWDWVVFQSSNPAIEICQPFHDGTPFNEVGEANTRLIATAPDGLALAEMVLDADGVMADSHPMAGKWSAIVDAARALKEKANG